MIKKVLALVVLIFLVSILGFSLAYALECDTNEDCEGDEVCQCDPNPGDGEAEGFCRDSDTVVICSPIGAQTWGELIDSITTYILWIATALAPALILIGGLYFVIGGGSEEKVRRAKRIITYTIIGYVIVLFAKGLVSILQNLVT